MTDAQKNIETEISKTGYVLEHKIAQVLKSNGWAVISGKYYVDEIEDAPREMDLIAYRVSRLDKEEIDLYTVLIISCKKSDENSWALLARDANLNDPNTDYWPLHAWTNDSALNYQLNRPKKAKDYHKGMHALGAGNAIADPDVEVFAFQEMNKISGAPKNDKAIFSAITSLVKAQAYELSSLPSRKKNKSIYQFNLISVVETELYRLMFAKQGNEIKCSKIDSELYIARYIFSKRESFSRIRFLTANAFTDALNDYSQLHSANAKWFSREWGAFYENIIKDPNRIKALENEFYTKIKIPIKLRIQEQFRNLPKFFEEPILSWNEEKDLLEISYFVPDEVERWMNNSPEINSTVRNALQSVYQYTGPFQFADSIPF
jgi:hypothetical protein